MAEFKTEHRISNVMKELGMTGDDVRSVYYAFDKLVILKKKMPESYLQRNRRTFLLDLHRDQEYVTRMQWLNGFIRSKGFSEDLFRNVLDYDTSVDDYDYWNEYKTPTQYRLDEEARSAVAP